MQEKLFIDAEVFQKERPTGLSKQQEQEFYLEQARDLIKKGYSESEEEDIIEDLKYLYPFTDNGFEMAKDLESHRRQAYYEIDTNFCEWLDNFHFKYTMKEKQNVRDWVKAHNPQPKFEKGTKLLVIEKLSHKIKKDAVVYINGETPEEAAYWINTDPSKYGGTIIAYEKVENCCVVVE